MTNTIREPEAFDRYWRMSGRRSIERLHEILTHGGVQISLSRLYDWSREQAWQARVAELDERARAVEDDARIAAIRATRERQTKLALLLQHKGTEWLAGIEAEDASAAAAIRALVEGTKLERAVQVELTAEAEAAPNEPDDRLERFSDDDLARLIELAEGSLGGAVPPPSE